MRSNMARHFVVCIVLILFVFGEAWQVICNIPCVVFCVACVFI